ncbi:SIR2 family protein [Proteiniborus sp. MB09-C3]|uniref:SIR2 family protein n=1 Tax=Proteiniborus sp. MB09-C3 TaxID=3050072 RepID=UPI0025559C52|nr:SIR2 family protein [Proteiniborus sp. MB09-C3]WIV11095.1 SIR2 family protein [Proteiniborus sp. MB09-C3]
MNSEIINFYKGKAKNEVTLEITKKEFAQCLQVENLNFLIGSGCSSFVKNGEESAIPTMNTLAKRFFDQNPDFSVQEVLLKEHFLDNLERMLDYMISIRLVNYVRPIENEIDLKLKTVQNFIKEQVILGMKCDEVNSLYKDFYLKILRKNRKSPINIFTTNYDLYSERALDELGFFYNNGFTGTVERKFNPISYNYAFVENMNLNKDIWDRVSNFFNVFKIHGSINWINKDMTVVEKSIENITDDTVMIYPTPLKDRTTLMTPYSDLMRNMQQSLMRNNCVLIVIGYSFSDDHINRIILNMLSVPSFRLVILGGGSNIDKLISIGDSRIWIINSTDKIHYFNNFVNKLLPDIQDEINERVELQERFKLIESALKGVD